VFDEGGVVSFAVGAVAGVALLPKPNEVVLLAPLLDVLLPKANPGFASPAGAGVPPEATKATSWCWCPWMNRTKNRLQEQGRCYCRQS
jgi:hypothetical protein